MAFNCQMCGKCCRNLGTENAEESAERAYCERRDHANAHGPFYHLVAWKDLTVSFFEWEIPPMMERAKELGVELRFKPLTGFYDDYGKAWGITTWQIDHKACPLQGADNKCRAYAQRANICRVFPFSTSFFNTFFDDIAKHGPDGMIRMKYKTCETCRAATKEAHAEGEDIRLGDCLKRMHDEFGEQFLFAYKGYRLRALLFAHILRGLKSSSIVKMHAGPIPPDRKKMVPAIQYLIGLGILPPGYVETLVAKVDAETEQLMKIVIR